MSRRDAAAGKLKLHHSNDVYVQAQSVEKIAPLSVKTRRSGFRTRLRDLTQGAHQATEALFTPFMEAPKEQLGWYLAAQRSALASVEPVAADALCRGMIRDLLDRLDMDLAHSGCAVTTIAAAPPLRSEAIDYIVLGSRLGTEVIKRRVFSAGETLPHYFRSDPQPKLWRNLCQSLDSIPVESDLALRITEDAKTGFALFAQAATLQQFGTNGFSHDA